MIRVYGPRDERERHYYILAIKHASKYVFDGDKSNVRFRWGIELSFYTKYFHMRQEPDENLPGLPNLPNHTRAERILLRGYPDDYSYLLGAYDMGEISFVLDAGGYWKILHLPTGMYLRYTSRKLTVEEREDIGGIGLDKWLLEAKKRKEEQFFDIVDEVKFDTLNAILRSEPDSEDIEWVEIDGEKHPVLSEILEESIYEEVKKVLDDAIEQAALLRDPDDWEEVISKKGEITAKCVRPLPEGELFRFDMTRDMDGDLRKLFFRELDSLADPEPYWAAWQGEEL